MEEATDGFQYGVKSIYETIGLCDYSNSSKRGYVGTRGKFKPLTCMTYAHVVLADTILANYLDLYILQSPYDFANGLIELHLQIQNRQGKTVIDHQSKIINNYLKCVSSKVTPNDWGIPCSLP